MGMARGKGFIAARRLEIGNRGLNFVLTTGALILFQTPAFTQDRTESAFSTEPASIWNAGVGEGFKEGTRELNFLAGAGLGLKMLGSRQGHDWALGIVDFGWMISDVVAPDHWYRGNWELLAEIFGGGVFHPNAAYLVGTAPHLRYNFAIGHRWVPFIDFGVGVTATDIRNGDLSTTFEFNLNAAIGTHYFLRDDLGLMLECRCTHLSNSGLEEPNAGVNTVTFLLGLSWLF
jgi:hypothetical protein